ncbi:MAG TPA: SDR family NAD(P)-dependent oxidoreductase [Solirubrobacterales bacterium]|nr:SDR family NAD(P)-dependent oxidoreductase [Solirubrobacterales bacterium]
MLIEPGTRAVVTGASRGVGRALCVALARRGARLGLLARGREALEELAAELPEGRGGSHIVLAADIAKRGEVKRALDRFAKRAQGLDLLVANAGVLHYAPFPDQDIDEAEQMVRVNVLGTLYTVKAALPHMLDGARGHIVILSSAAGLRSFPWGAVNGGSKAFDRGFAEALRHELSGTGVSLTTVYPGEFATTILDHQRDRLPDWRANEAERPVGELVNAILRGIEDDARAVYAPGAVRVLGLSGIAPRLTDRLLARVRGRTAAPRTD